MDVHQSLLIVYLVMKYLRLRRTKRLEEIDFDWFYEKYYGSKPKS